MIEDGVASKYVNGRWSINETMWDLDHLHQWIVFLNMHEDGKLGVRRQFGLPWYLPGNWELVT
jgi:hypothetical protein